MEDKCHVILINKEVTLGEAEHAQTTTLHVMGMGCVNCANRVHNSLIDHPGVVGVEVSHVTGKAEVTYLTAKVNISQLINRVAQAGDHRHVYRAVHFGVENS